MVAGQRIEDYGLIGSLRTAALVGRNGSIDWLALPRFDSPACFSALLGDKDNGCWTIAPQERPHIVCRRYVEGTLVLETTFQTSSGSVQLMDFMPFSEEGAEDLVRVVRGVRGTVPMRLDLRLRFDFGRTRPWIRRLDGHLVAVAGPHAIRLDTPLQLDPDPNGVECGFEVREGQSVPFVLTWYPSYRDSPPRRDHWALLQDTVGYWQDWSGHCESPEDWSEAVVRSAITLKALTHRATGGIVAAPTTSLPERLGGMRNWDYRYCWLRDATFTTYALVKSGYLEEARAWREWLRRAVAGEPSKLQIMYGLAGERRLDEQELPWLRGYENSAPVRVGNDAYRQRQLDVYGVVMDAFHTYRIHGLELDEEAWQIALALMPFVEEHWRDPGAGMWEQRGERRSYVTSRVMCWVAFDRAIKGVERFGLKGPADRWKRFRSAIHEDVCRHGYNESRGAFVEAPGEERLDASVLLIPLVGFLPPNDPRVVSTLEAIRRELTEDGFVRRYDSDKSDDGFPAGEAPFVVCTLWMADNLALMGREREAREIFERVLDIRNDLGLLSEQYDTTSGRQLGNFPQALSHVGVINTAHNLSHSEGPAQRRSREKEETDASST